MTDNIQKIDSKRFLIATLSLYILASIPLLIFFRHQLNPDGISYISIAHKYASGDFGNAINGLWSPMYSWLLAPFLALGANAQLSAELLNLLFGLLTIIAVFGLARRLDLGKLSTNLVLISTAAVALSFAIRIITPDLLSVLIVLVYLNVIFSEKYSAGIKHGVICGILGTMAYLAKSYMFTFFIGHFFLMNILHWYLCQDNNKKKKKIAINMLCGYIVFIALCSPWIMLLSDKYEKFTTTNAGAFNMSRTSPGFKGRLQTREGFIPPANDTATSFMEDPAGLNMPKWSPIESTEAFKYYLTHNFEENVRELARFLKKFSHLSLAILIATVLLVMHPLRTLNDQQKIALFILLTFLVFPTGYILVIVLERYVWLMCFLLILMGGFITDRLAKSESLSKPAIILLSLAIAIPFVYMQTKALRHYDIAFDNSAHQAASLLQNDISKHSKIASDTEFRKSLFMSYHLAGGYYGFPKPNATCDEILAELKKHDIDYYLVWQESDINSEVLADFEEMSPPELKKPKVYRIKK